MRASTKALSAPNIGRAAGKVHVTAFKVYYLPCSYYSEKNNAPRDITFCAGCYGKKTGRCQKNQYSYPIGDWKGEQNWFSQNLFSAKYSTFATAAPKLWKAQKGVLVLQSQPQWEPSLTDIQVLCTQKKKNVRATSRTKIPSWCLHVCILVNKNWNFGVLKLDQNLVFSTN